MQNRLFRKAVEEDREAIVALLKASLGETSSPKSIAYWNWKHEQNPFGKSEVMISEEDGTLSGIRAMMPWTWQAGHQQFKAYRAVDTATHPDFQGKGIFSKLTRTMLEHLKTIGSEFIFNTPNSQSLPGYLKMGWQEWGRIKVLIIPFIFIRCYKWNEPHQQSGIVQLESLCNQWNDMQSQHGKLFTPKSPAYLQWRYLDNPVIKYHCYADSELFVAVHFKKHKRFTELRISELITAQNHSKVKSRLFGFLKELSKHNKVHFITLSEEASHNFRLPGLALQFGPLLTIRKLSDREEIPEMLQWSPALGDLELF
jgi:GNAT superfamily N-acetyltransferase